MKKKKKTISITILLGVVFRGNSKFLYIKHLDYYIYTLSMHLRDVLKT